MQLLQRVSRTLVFLFVGVASAVSLLAQQPADDLSAPAKEAMQKGVSAAGQKEWKLAIRYFEEARKAAAHSPIALYNLALAEMQIPGRELRATAWFEAYLLAAPQTDKAAAIRTQIAALELKPEANAGQIIDMLKQISATYPAESYESNSAAASIAQLQAQIGDVDAAVAASQRLISHGAYYNINDIVGALAKAGHFTEAKRMAGNITDANYRSSGFYRVLMEQTEKGLLADARDTLNQGLDDSDMRNALCNLAKAEYKAGEREAAVQRLARADALAKAMSASDKSKAADRNRTLSQIAKVHLDVDDWRGAKALLPLVQNEKDHALQNELMDDLATKLDALLVARIGAKDFKPDDWKEAEALADEQPARDLRAAEYARLATLPALKDQPDQLAALAKKTEALLAGAKRAKEKVFIYSALADINAVRGDSASSSRWRQQGLAACVPALQEPDKVNADLSKTFGTSWVIRERLTQYNVASEFRRLCSGADLNKDEASLRKAVEAARLSVPKFPEKNSGFSYILEGWMDAVFSLASQTHKPGDLDAVAKFVQEHGKRFASYTLNPRLLSISAERGKAGDAPAAEKFINLIPDTAARTKELNDYLKLKYSGQINEAIRKVDFNAAAKAIAQMPDGDSKAGKQRDLANAQASEGDFTAAANSAAAMADTQARLNVAANVAWERVDAGDHARIAQMWQEKQALLAAVTEPARRMNLQSDLCSSAPTPALARELMPPFFAEVRAIPDATIRLEKLRLVSQIAEQAGLFAMQREARSEALMTAATIKDSERWPLNNLDLNAGECLEQATGASRDAFVESAATRLASAGNITAAQALAARLPDTNADDVQAKLALAFAERGDFAAARAAQEKIAGEYPRSNTTGAVVHAFVKAGNLIAAKDYAEHTWPKTEGYADALVKEMAKAGEVAWASANIKRLGGIYGPGARATVAALQIKQGDLSTAEAAFAGCSYDFDRTELIRAAADSGHIDLAIKWMKSSNTGPNEIIAAQVQAGDVEGARVLAAQVKRNSERIRAYRALATAQAKAGDLDGARATFRDSSKQDKRTPPNFDAEPFINCQLAEALARKPDFTAALTVANAITDPFWHDRAFTTIASSAAPKDSSAACTALKGISDPLSRSKLAWSLVDPALKENHPGDALLYLDLASDEGFRAVGLVAVINYGINHGDIAEALPRVSALTDPAARADLLINALRARVFLDVKTGNVNLPEAAAVAVAAMPADYSQARFYADLARLSGKLNPASAQVLRDKTMAAAKALAGPDAAKWQRYVESAKQTAEAAGKNPVGAKEDKVQKARESAIDNWTSLLQSDSQLNAPLFIDFRATLDGLANSVPSSATNKSAQLFSNVQQQAQRLIDALKDVRALRTKVAQELKTAAAL